jgi:hypothetical protein
MTDGLPRGEVVQDGSYPIGGEVNRCAIPDSRTALFVAECETVASGDVRTYPATYGALVEVRVALDDAGKLVGLARIYGNHDATTGDFEVARLDLVLSGESAR